jgi:hypothetical protein
MVSQMNPNLCAICETNFTRVKKTNQVIIPATILFADLRGYTSLSERAEATKVLGLLHRFYDECAALFGSGMASSTNLSVTLCSLFLISADA